MKEEFTKQVDAHITEKEEQNIAAEGEHTAQKNKLEMKIIMWKSDHSEVLSKQREQFDLEAHKVALDAETKLQKVLQEHLSELKTHHDKFMNILKNKHEQAIHEKEDQRDC